MKSTSSSLILLLTSFIWGMAFVSQSQASSFLGALGYNGTRMLLGFITLLPFILKSFRKKKKEDFYPLLRDGLVCGILLSLASFFQQKGIESTTAGKAGFITSLYILIVPVISLFMGKKIGKKTWLSVLGGLVGAYLLSSGGKSAINKGDALVFVSAFLFSFHVIYIDKVGGKYNSIELSAVQFFFAGLIAFTLSLFFEDNTIADYRSALVPVLYGGIFSCGIAYTLQIVGQKNTPATKATLILSLESVFSLLGGVIILKERMNTEETIGSIILFLSVIYAELSDSSNQKKE